MWLLYMRAFLPALLVQWVPAEVLHIHLVIFTNCHGSLQLPHSIPPTLLWRTKHTLAIGGESQTCSEEGDKEENWPQMMRLLSFSFLSTILDNFLAVNQCLLSIYLLDIRHQVRRVHYQTQQQRDLSQETCIPVGRSDQKKTTLQIVMRNLLKK